MPTQGSKPTVCWGKKKKRREEERVGGRERGREAGGK